MRIQVYKDYINNILQKSKASNDLISVYCIVAILSYFKDVYFNDVIQTPDDLLYILIAQKDFEEHMSLVYLEEGMMDEFAEHQEKSSFFKNIIKDLSAL